MLPMGTMKGVEPPGKLKSKIDLRSIRSLRILLITIRTILIAQKVHTDLSFLCGPASHELQPENGSISYALQAPTLRIRL